MKLSAHYNRAPCLCNFLYNGNGHSHPSNHRYYRNLFVSGEATFPFLFRIFGFCALYQVFRKLRSLTKIACEVKRKLFYLSEQSSRFDTKLLKVGLE